MLKPSMDTMLVVLTIIRSLKQLMLVLTKIRPQVNNASTNKNTYLLKQTMLVLTKIRPQAKNASTNKNTSSSKQCYCSANKNTSSSKQC